MGTICILLGLIIFIGSIFGGCALAAYVMNIQSTVAASLATTTSFTLGLTTVQCYSICVGICGFIGLLIGLNLIMNGMIYRKVSKLSKKNKK